MPGILTGMCEPVHIRRGKLAKPRRWRGGPSRGVRGRFGTLKTRGKIQGFDQPRLARLRLAVLDGRYFALADRLRGGESAAASEDRVLA